jgi:hypothetical protein
MWKLKGALPTSTDAKIIHRRETREQRWHGEENGEDEPAAVDEGGRADAEDACAPEDKDNSDCAETWADRGSDLSEGMDDWCDAGARSAEASLKAAGHTTWWAGLIALLRIGTAPRRNLGEIHYRCRIVILE